MKALPDGLKRYQITLSSGGGKAYSFVTVASSPEQAWNKFKRQAYGQSALKPFKGNFEIKAMNPHRHRRVRRMSGGKRNPYGKRARYKHRRVRRMSYFDRRSIRTIRRGKKRILVGCPKGRYKRGRCRAGTRALSVLTPKRKKRRNRR